MTDQVKFDSPKDKSSIIKVIGVGGGGTNAVNHMSNQGITGVDFIVCNTDSQSLDISPVPTKIQLGADLTEGRGAGSKPEQGRNAALENIEDLRGILEQNTKMLFITAGMGGGTGTGGSPVIASLARELDILTVGIVTIPFSFEGRKRMQQAEKGIEELKKHVDTLLIIVNDNLRHLYGNLSLSEAFSKADNILASAAKGIAELITVPGYVNVDFEDVNTVMRNSGVALMGSGSAEGEDRAKNAVEEAISSPLLNDNDIDGADNILLYISSGKDEVQMDEVIEMTDLIREKAGPEADVIWGHGFDESLGNRINITLIATGFEAKSEPKVEEVVHTIERIKVGDLYDGTEDEPKAEIEEEKPVEKEDGFKLYERPSQDTGINLFPGKTDFDKPIHEIIRETPAPAESVNTERQPLFSKKEEDEKEEASTEPYKRKDQNPVADPSTMIEVNSKERRQKLKDMSLKLRKPTEISEMETQPAYMRRNIKLADPPSSSESEISRFTLSESDKSGAEIRSNNSFLHDNID